MNLSAYDALLLVNGEMGIREKSILHTLNWKVLIVTDGAVSHARKWGLKPDILIGDFDSVSEADRADHQEMQWLHRPSEEIGDLEKSLMYCVDQGFNSIMVMGFTGRRIDHTLGNISVMIRYYNKLNMTCHTPFGELFIVQDSSQWRTWQGQPVSLIPFGKADGVKTHGLKFPLKGETLALGMREGTSNEALGESVAVSIISGTLLVFFGRDYAT
jgi:thiamine pyrophosphokinase